MKLVTARESDSLSATPPLTLAPAGSIPSARAPVGSTGAAPTCIRRADDGDGAGAAAAAAGIVTASAPASVTTAVIRRPVLDRLCATSGMLRPADMLPLLETRSSNQTSARQCDAPLGGRKNSCQQRRGALCEEGPGKSCSLGADAVNRVTRKASN